MNLLAYMNNPGAVAVVAALVVLYVRGARRSPGKLGRNRKILFAMVAFGLLLTLGPLDAIGVGDRLFFVHMIEHFLLTLAIPPLLLLSTPDWMLRPWMLRGGVRSLFGFVTRPLVAFLLFTALFVGAHYPLVLDAACHHAGLRVMVHLLFVVAGLVMWWPIMSPLPEFPRLSHPHQILYLFLLLIPMTAVAAPITLAHSIQYTWYVPGPHPLGLTPMEDQVLGGLFMWIGNGLYLMCVFSAIFFEWSREEEESLRGTESSRRGHLKAVTTPRARA